jgi:hypothetical protein
MTGYESKRAAARDKLDDDDTQVYQDHDDTLTIAYQSGYYDGKKAAQTTQEPIGYAVPTFGFDNSVIKKVHYARTVPLYTAPPQRPWVGLTDEDIAEGLEQSWVTAQAFQSAVWWAEVKLKEKNTM